MGFTLLLCHLASDTQAWLLLCHLASDIQVSSNFNSHWMQNDYSVLKSQISLRLITKFAYKEEDKENS